MFQLWPLATSKPVSSSTLKSILCSTRSGIQARNKDAGIESQKTEAKLAEMVNERRRMKILNYCNFWVFLWWGWWLKCVVCSFWQHLLLMIMNEDELLNCKSVSMSIAESESRLHQPGCCISHSPYIESVEFSQWSIKPIMVKFSPTPNPPQPPSWPRL